MSSGISWTDEMWSVVTGCTKVSAACDHCYALSLSAGKLGRVPMYAGVARKGDDGPEWTGLVRTHPDRLDMPQRWRTPRRVFVAGMADLFHPSVPDGFIADTFTAMSRAPQHSYQVLTKRPRRMRHLVTALALQGGAPTGAWCGTTIEDDDHTWRAEHVRRTPAAVRWLSLEPLLGPLPSLYLRGIDWVVIGGESGSGRRPMELAWVLDIIERADAAGTAVFVKQDSSIGRPGQQGRLPDDVWARKEFPT